MAAGLDRNFRAVGRVLASLSMELYRHADGGLVLVEDGQARQIITAKDLSPVLIDNLRITVIRNGRFHSEKPSDSILNNMLRARKFLDNFKTVKKIVTTPIALADHSPSTPGFNDGGILHLGEAASTAADIKCIAKFLDVMEFQSEADRSNVVAALLTVPLRHHFPGGKPLVLITSTKSHSGKGTLTEFIRGRTPKAEITFQDKDWPMERTLHDQLARKPEIGVINFDNVRTDSSGRAKFIRSAFLESFLTNSETVVSSATSRNQPFFSANHFVILLNTNEGSLSVDLLNRSLPIRLSPTGDLSERIARAKEMLGCDVKHEWLPNHRDQIESELWGMVDRWAKSGKPFNKTIDHPMGPWAQTVGGILNVNGFTEFLANYGTTRAGSDPVHQALSVLAFHAGDTPRRAGELAGMAVAQGLAKTLLPGVDPANEPARQRTMGVTLRPCVGETFTVTTPAERITYRLRRQQGRFNEKHPHFRYIFEEIARVAVTEDSHGGLILEESPGKLELSANQHLPRWREPKVPNHERTSPTEQHQAVFP